MEKSILERFNNIINNKITIMRKILCILGECKLNCVKLQ